MSESPHPEASREAAPPTNRMAIALLSLIGLFIAFYLMAHSLGWTGPLVCGIGECETVQSSPYAKIGPVPVSVLGFAGYAMLLGVSILGIQPGFRASRSVGVALVGGSTVALAYSAYLTYLEARVIHAWCQWCVTSAIIITLIFLASLPEVSRIATGNRP